MSIGWGFIGAGWIAQRAMAPAVHHAEGAHLQSVASRDMERSRLLEPRSVHEKYEGVLADPDVDVVYICLANHQHLEWVTAALEAGKHVLCEKPLAMNAAEAELMAAAARQADRLLVEAVWNQWHPRFRRLVELVNSGGLGQITEIDSAFTFPASLDGNYRNHPEFGGGAWMDVGGYQVQAWLALMADEDCSVQAVQRTIGGTGIDLTTEVTARIGERTIAAGVASFERPEDQRLVVTGSEATAWLEPQQAFTTWREPSTLQLNDITETFPKADAYQLMVEAVSDRVAGADSWVVPLEQSLRTASVLDLIALQ